MSFIIIREVPHNKWHILMQDSRKTTPILKECNSEEEVLETIKKILPEHSMIPKEETRKQERKIHKNLQTIIGEYNKSGASLAHLLKSYRSLAIWIAENNLAETILKTGDMGYLHSFWKVCAYHGIYLKPEEKKEIFNDFFQKAVLH